MKYSKQSLVLLNVNEEHIYKLANGREKRIRLLSCRDFRDAVIHRLRRTEVTVDIDGKPLVLVCAPHVMPTEVDGLRIQADMTSAWCKDARSFEVDMHKDVQFSLWDASDPIVDTDLFGFPLPDYRLFSHGTQTYPEVVHQGLRDSSPQEGAKFYHVYGEDMGGYDERQPIVSCTDGIVVEPPLGASRYPRPDRLYIKGEDGLIWFYSHFDSHEPTMKPGREVKKGQVIGIMGIQGPSGRWPHVHVGICVPDKSRVEEGAYRTWNELRLYPWLITAHAAQYPGNLYAVARLHQLILAGETASFDGTNSLCFGSDSVSYKWVFHDGTIANGPKAEKAYDKPGVYAATLWVSDAKGRRDVDFCRVKVHRAENPQFLPTIVIAHFPTRPIVGQPIHFRGWVQTEEAKEKMTIDFGDGTVLENWTGFSNVEHSYKTGGIHVVTVHTTFNDMPVTEKAKVIIDNE